METVDGLGLEPQAVLPLQFHAVRATSAEKRLMLAVLQDAVEICRKYDRVRGGKRSRLFTETERWLSSDDTSWPLSFVNVCHALGIDVGRLRAELRHPGVTGMPAAAAVEPLAIAS